MSRGPRPVLLGYIRVSALPGLADLLRVEAELADFVAREGFSLGTVFTEQDGVPGAFSALLEELGRNDTARGVLIPDLRHLSCDEQLILSRHEHGAQTPVLVVNFTPLAGGPGAVSPVCAGSAIPAGKPPAGFRKRG